MTARPLTIDRPPRRRLGFARLLWLAWGAAALAVLAWGADLTLRAVVLPETQRFAGTLSPARDPLVVALPAALPLGEVLVGPGDTVRAGQTVALLDRTLIETRLTALRRDLALAGVARDCLMTDVAAPPGDPAPPEKSYPEKSPAQKPGADPELAILIEAALARCRTEARARAVARDRITAARATLEARAALLAAQITATLAPPAPELAPELAPDLDAKPGAKLGAKLGAGVGPAPAARPGPARTPRPRPWTQAPPPEPGPGRNAAADPSPGDTQNRPSNRAQNRLERGLALALERNRVRGRIEALAVEYRGLRAAQDRDRLDQVDALSAQIAQALTAQAVLARALAAPRLRASEPGTVRRVRPVAPGTTLAAETELVEILPQGQTPYRAEIDLTEAQAKALNQNTPVRITLLGYPEPRPILTGHITAITRTPNAPHEPPFKATVKLSTQSTKHLENPNAGIALKGTKTASLITAQKIPKSAKIKIQNIIKKIKHK